MNEKFKVLTNDKEIHFKIDPTITFGEMCLEMKELIEIRHKTRKAMLNHYKIECPLDLKSPEYKAWYKEKLRLDKESSLAYQNVDMLARLFCPMIYIV